MVDDGREGGREGRMGEEAKKEGEAPLVRSPAPASPNGPLTPTQSKLILFSMKPHFEPQTAPPASQCSWPCMYSSADAATSPNAMSTRSNLKAGTVYGKLPEDTQ